MAEREAQELVAAQWSARGRRSATSSAAIHRTGWRVSWNRVEGLAGLLATPPLALVGGTEAEEDNDAAADQEAQSGEPQHVEADRGSTAEEVAEPAPVAPKDRSPKRAVATTSTPSPATTRLAKPSAPANAAAAAVVVGERATKMGPASIDLSVHSQLRTYANRVELSFAVIALRAVEAHADELSQHWLTPPQPAKAGLFAGAAIASGRGVRRAEPPVQIQLRMSPTDADVLDGLVHDWLAPSRSALSTRRYAGTCRRNPRAERRRPRPDRSRSGTPARRVVKRVHGRPGREPAGNGNIGTLRSGRVTMSA